MVDLRACNRSNAWKHLPAAWADGSGTRRSSGRRSLLLLIVLIVDIDSIDVDIDSSTIVVDRFGQCS